MNFSIIAWFISHVPETMRIISKKKTLILNTIPAQVLISLYHLDFVPNIGFVHDALVLTVLQGM